MITLARLHAALDLVVETEQHIQAIPRSSPAVVRLTERLHEARELLRALLDHRQAVGKPIS
jgi:hypothetical protein